MKVIKITPRGYCHGVVHALNLVSETISNKDVKRPIYILGQIVHNQNVTDAFNEAGAITIEGENRAEILSKVDSGTVIVTAHGIDPKLIDLAKKKGLDVIDGTCIDVYKTHDIIKEKINDGYEIMYIGKKGHPEPEGVLSLDENLISLITSEVDIDNYISTRDKICITNQTTMSMWDTKALMDYARELYPNIEVINEICLATQQRQEAVLDMARNADLTIVVGDPKSNNTIKLVEISEKLANTKAYRISSARDIKLEWLMDPNVDTVAVTSGASTPTLITKKVCDFIEAFDRYDESTHDMNILLELSRIIPRIKK